MGTGDVQDHATPTPTLRNQLGCQTPRRDVEHQHLAQPHTPNPGPWEDFPDVRESLLEYGRTVASAKRTLPTTIED